MNDNVWYENASDNNGIQNSNNADAKKKRKIATLGTLIICILITALLAGSAGGLVVYFAQNNAPGITSTALDSGNEDQEEITDSAKPSARLLNADPYALERDMSDVAAEVMPTVVYIQTERRGTDFFGQQSIAQGSGSGVIITKDGYIVTNNHVISGAGKIMVSLMNGKEFEAELIGADNITDLAVIKINAKDLEPAIFGDSTKLMVGDRVLAVGNPLGKLASTVTQGIISALDREITVEGQRMSLLQTDAAINPGNSGGGLFNGKGELIGIVNAKTMALEVEGLGFAIPVSTASRIVADLMDNGFVSGRPYLGVNLQDVTVVVDDTDSFRFNPFGINGQRYITRVQVMAVQEQSAADKAGIRENDYILKLNDTEIENSSHFTSLINEYAAGDMVTLTVQRGNDTEQIKVTLGERNRA
ncbi:MAG: Serine protease Do-like HtrB [Firmicutes bacterium ADurb.Bin182]|nr:MAG: Serine protease Do-like HtrB [Firmicutes bacterium ADurb.Bin182]